MAFVRYPQFVGTEETTLWVNPSPTSSFSAQAIPLSSEYTDFDYIEVNFRFSTSNSLSRTAIIPKETLQASDTYNTFAIGMNSGSGNTRLRGAYASSATSIQIGQSYQLQSSSQTASNDYIIPTSIVGIKTGAVPTFFNTELTWIETPSEASTSSSTTTKTYTNETSGTILVQYIQVTYTSSTATLSFSTTGEVLSGGSKASSGNYQVAWRIVKLESNQSITWTGMSSRSASVVYVIGTY